MKSFKKFGWGEASFGDWEENFGKPMEEKSGACAYFDCWPSCSSFQMRVWHIKKDQHIKLTGRRFLTMEKETKYIEEYCEHTKTDESSYLTIFTININAKLSGFIKVVVEGEDCYDNDTISWGKGKIKDFRGSEANLTPVKGGYEVEEILTVKEAQNFAMQDRVDKLRQICMSLGYGNALYQLDRGKVLGDFKV